MTREDFIEATKPLRDKLDNNEKHNDFAIATDSVRAMLDLAEEGIEPLADMIKKWQSGPIMYAPIKELRDEFAMAALSGILSDPVGYGIEAYDKVMELSYKMADAMIKARKL